MNATWSDVRGLVDRLTLELCRTAHPLPSREMCELLIVGEDHRFWSHCGVDFWALARALFQTLVLGSPQGGSTIAMQLVRTLTRRYERTLARKFMEIALAIRLTRYVGRDRIPTLYLWVAYYGWRMNDLQQACVRLSVEPCSTDRFKLARFVARLKYPEPRRVSTNRLASIQRRMHYLVRLHDRNTREDGEHPWKRFEYQVRLEG